jgi:hypothetical protein
METTHSQAICCAKALDSIPSEEFDMARYALKNVVITLHIELSNFSVVKATVFKAE